MDVFGKCWQELDLDQQLGLLGFDKTRRFEEFEDLIQQLEVMRG